jgi:hypothetical protein
MGIRLQCPNGHKVHVKSFLAGKRGICPQCGAKFDIPVDPAWVSDDGGGDEISVVTSSAGEVRAASESTSGPVTTPNNPAGTTNVKAKGDAFDPAPLDLDALAAASGSSLLGSQAFGPAGQRLASRRKSTQKMRTFTLVLTVTVTVLACVLLYIVFRAR